MSNTPFIWTVKTVGLSKSQFLDTITRLQKEIKSNNGTFINGEPENKVDLGLFLEVTIKDTYGDNVMNLVGDNMVIWVTENYGVDTKQHLKLKISSNRFIFDWFAQSSVDYGAIIEKFESIEGNLRIFDTTKPIKPTPPKPKKKGFFDNLIDNVKPFTEFVEQNRGMVISTAMLVGGVLLTKNLQDSLVKTTEETVRKTMKEYDPPSIEIHIDENGYFDDALVSR